MHESRSLQRLLRFPIFLAALLTLAAVLVFLIYFLVLNQGIPTWWSDSYEYVDVARNVAQGRGLEMTAHYVLDTWLLRSYSLPLPYVHHDPGLALLMGLAMFLLGANNTAVAWTGGLVYILLVPLTFFFGWKLYNKYVGLLAALLALINVQLLSYSTTGLSEIPYAFSMTLFWFALYRQRTRLDIFISGLLFGWLWILRSNTLSALPFVLLFLIIAPASFTETFVWSHQIFSLLWEKRGAILQRIAIFLVGLVLVLMPYLIRNWQTLGNPFYTVPSMYALVFYTDVFEGGKNTEIFSNVGAEINPVQYILTHPDQLWSKMTYQLPSTLEYLWEGTITGTPTIVDAIEIVLLLLSAIIPRPNEPARQRYFRWTIYLCILSALLVGSVTHLRWRHLYGFLPVVLIFISEFSLKLTALHLPPRPKFPERIVQNPLVVIALVTIILAIPGALAINRTVGFGHVLDRQYRAIGRWLQQSTPDNAFILIERGDASNGMPSAMSWYSQREIAEFDAFTVQYFREQIGVRPLYVLFVTTKPADQLQELSQANLSNYQQISQRKSNLGLNAYLYAPAPSTTIPAAHAQPR